MMIRPSEWYKKMQRNENLFNLGGVSSHGWSKEMTILHLQSEWVSQWERDHQRKQEDLWFLIQAPPQDHVLFIYLKQLFLYKIKKNIIYHTNRTRFIVMFVFCLYLFSIFGLVASFFIIFQLPLLLLIFAITFGLFFYVNLVYLFIVMCFLCYTK